MPTHQNHLNRQTYYFVTLTCYCWLSLLEKSQVYVFVFSTNVKCPILVGNCRQSLAIPSYILQIESVPYTIIDDHQKITAYHAKIISDHAKIIPEHVKMTFDHAGIISDRDKIIADRAKMTFDHAEIIFNRIKIAPDHRNIAYDGSGAGSTKPAKTFFLFL